VPRASRDGNSKKAGVIKRTHNLASFIQASEYRQKETRQGSRSAFSMLDPKRPDIHRVITHATPKQLSCKGDFMTL
jgi:hypothetical protein